MKSEKLSDKVKKLDLRLDFFNIKAFFLLILPIMLENCRIFVQYLMDNKTTDNFEL